MALICRIPDSALSEYNYYMDTSKLRITVSNMKNANSRAELERIKTTTLENLSKLPAAPSVPFESRPPALATVRLRPRPCMAAARTSDCSWKHLTDTSRHQDTSTALHVISLTTAC